MASAEASWASRPEWGRILWGDEIARGAAVVSLDNVGEFARRALRALTSYDLILEKTLSCRKASYPLCQLFMLWAQTDRGLDQDVASERAAAKVLYELGEAMETIKKHTPRGELGWVVLWGNLQLSSLELVNLVCARFLRTARPASSDGHHR